MVIGCGSPCPIFVNVILVLINNASLHIAFYALQSISVIFQRSRGSPSVIPADVVRSTILAYHARITCSAKADGGFPFRNFPLIAVVNLYGVCHIALLELA